MTRISPATARNFCIVSQGAEGNEIKGAEVAAQDGLA